MGFVKNAMSGIALKLIVKLVIVIIVISILFLLFSGVLVK